jgi:hypothetical protein
MLPQTLRRSYGLVLFALVGAGCTQLSLGQCNTTADCKSGSTCDTTQSPPVCVIEEGTCFPSCPNGQACRSGACVAQGCAPACTATQVCDLDAGTCVGVTQAQITITSPATNTFVGSTLNATVDAIAPTGVTAVRFQLGKNGQPIAQGSATASPTSSDAANWAGGVSLSSLTSSADGPAQLVAIATISGGGTALSPALTVQIDLTPPVISMVTDGRTTLYPGGAMVQVRAQLSDTGAGFLPSAQAKLVFTSVTHAAITGPVTSGIANFLVPLDDVLAPPGSNSTIPFSITAMDAVGNSATLSGDPKQVIRVDRHPPGGTITAVTHWNSQATLVQVSGSITDSGGSISGGLAAVQLTHNGAMVGTATISTSSDTAGTWTGTIDLSAQTFAAGFEGPWAYTARFLDAAGNSSTADSTLLVDDGAPQISLVQVLTPPSSDNLYAAGPNLAITAQITDGSGVAGAKLAFQGQAAVAGTTLDGGAWSFSVPRPSGTFDGVTVPFTVSASDLFADAGLSQAAAAVHSASATQAGLDFDNKPPAIAIAANSNWYVRVLPDGGAAVLEIDATISDGSGIAANPTLTPLGGSAVSGSVGNGNLWRFFVDPAQSFAANDAGPLAFTVAASDLAGNSASASGTRNIDGAGPGLSGLSIYRAGDAPDAGLHYPTAATSTGHDGSHFIYNDTITVTGTVTDRGAGLRAVALQINGALVDGGSIAGTPIPIACGSSTTCTVSQSIALNAAGNGALNSPFVDGGLPAAIMNVAIIATDSALLPDGGAANQGISGAGNPTPIAVTRYLWRQALPHVTNTVSTSSPSNVGNGILGIAIHPNGDLIVTGNSDGTKASADMIFAARSAGPLADGGANLDWSWGGSNGKSGVNVGSPSDSPAIGIGDANSALVYVASSGYLTALKPDGGLQWQFAQTDMAFGPSPAIVETNVSSGSGPLQSVEEVIATADPASLPAIDPILYGMYLPTGASNPTVNSATLSGSASLCPPLALNNQLAIGTDDGAFAFYTLSSSGNFVDAGTYLATGAGYLEPIANRDGTEVIVAYGNATAAPVYELNTIDGGSSLLGIYGGVSAPPALDASGHLYVPTSDNNLYAVQTVPAGTAQLVASLSAPGFTPLAGSDGHLYLPYDSGNLFAFTNGAVSWAFSRGRKISPMATMDCQGILYFGSGQYLYALVTDDHGLADSGWPTHRRDSRSSGNASALKYGIRSSAGCTQ